MKTLLFLLAAVVLTGCTSFPHNQSAPQAQALPPGSTPRYEYELEYVSADGYTPFLHLVEVDP